MPIPDLPPEGVWPTLAQWIAEWNTLSVGKQEQVARRVLAAFEDSNRCLVENHAGLLAEVARLRSQIDGLKELGGHLADEADGQVASLWQQRDDLAAAVTDLTAERDGLLSQLADAEEPQVDLEYVDRLTAERDDLQRRIDAALMECDASEALADHHTVATADIRLVLTAAPAPAPAPGTKERTT